MNIKSSLLEAVGNTPLVRLDRLAECHDIKANLVAKLEFLNPYSVKDRVAKQMLLDAKKCGAIKKGSAIVEPTSGNTGIGLAFASSILGYKLTLVMPESMSIERRKLLTQLGAELVLTEAKLGMQGAIDKANEIALQTGAFVPSQFSNASNPLSHSLTTAVELLADTDKKIDIFVAGVGTGGTVSGVGAELKKQIKNVKIVAVEPTESAVISGQPKGAHGIQGIGAGFVPQNLNTDIIDQVVTVSTADAIATAKQLAITEGMTVGISSGASVFAGLQLAKLPENKGKNIVVIMPDSGERYLSTPLFD